jgi:argininosuccinate lyase
VPFRLAHSAVGQAVRLALEKKCELEGLSLEELKQFRAEFEHDFFNSLKLESVLASHDVPGGTAPGRVRGALDEARRRIAEMRNSN